MYIKDYVNIPEVNDSDNESVTVEVPECTITDEEIVHTAGIFLGNIDPRVTKQDIKKQISLNHKFEVKLSCIEKLPTRGINNAFKITVPKDKLDLAMTGWKPRVKVEPYTLNKPLVFAGNTKKDNQNTKGNRNPRGKINNHRFQSSSRNTSGRNYRSNQRNPDWGDPSYSNWCDQYSLRPNGYY